MRLRVKPGHRRTSQQNRKPNKNNTTGCKNISMVKNSFVAHVGGSYVGASLDLEKAVAMRLPASDCLNTKEAKENKMKIETREKKFQPYAISIETEEDHQRLLSLIELILDEDSDSDVPSYDEIQAFDAQIRKTQK